MKQHKAAEVSNRQQRVEKICFAFAIASPFLEGYLRLGSMNSTRRPPHRRFLLDGNSSPFIGELPTPARLRIFSAFGIFAGFVRWRLRRRNPGPPPFSSMTAFTNRAMLIQQVQ